MVRKADVLEILKRAKGDSGELAKWNMYNEQDQKALQDEVNIRTCKAGYTTRQGNPTHGTKIQNLGYGDKPINVWPRDENGNLIGD